MSTYYNINGKVVLAEEAVINVKDLGFLRGYSVFDFFRIYKGQPVFIKDHLARLRKSAAFLELEVPFSDDAIIENILSLVEINKMDFGGIKIILTGGYSSDGWSPAEPNLIMIVGKLPKYTEAHYTKGVKLMSYKYVRDTPYTKSTNYLVPIKIQKEIKEAEAFDVLYHDGKYVSESARSNFFIIDEKNTLITPDKDSLEGITRKHVLKIAAKHFDVEIRPITIEETRKAKEAFITSSTKGVMPVRQIDFWRINKGIIGDMTKQLGTLFEAYVEEYIAAFVEG